jgi:hypothetical protein
MSRDAAFRTVVGAVRRHLKARGFSARGSTFAAKQGDNTLLIALQRSTKAPGMHVAITLNYGVHCAAAGRALGEAEDASTDVWRAHWRKRLSDDGREQWIRFDASGAREDELASILESVDRVVDELRAHSTDEALRDEWLTGASPGQGAMQRMLFLAVLLKKLGPQALLDRVVGDLRKLVAGGVHEGLTEERLKTAGL